MEIDPNYFRPAEVDLLQGDYSKAQTELGWKPKLQFKELIKMMYEADFKREKNNEKLYPKYF